MVHQYRQYEQAPPIFTHSVAEHNKLYDVGNPGHGLGQTQNMAG